MAGDPLGTPSFPFWPPEWECGHRELITEGDEQPEGS